MSDQREWRWNNVPVPVAHVGLLVIGAAATLVRRRPISASASVRRVGWPLIVGGVAMGTWAVRTAGRIDLEHPNRLVTGGPYARSRHPMYVAWTLIYLGIALVANTKWPLMLTPILAAITHREVLREEERLLESFGPDYATYQSQVRRYL